MTTHVDTANHVVYGEVTTLSPFHLGYSGSTGVPAFPNVYVGIAAAFGAVVLAYFIRRRMIAQELQRQ